jgi:hypothetical protein
MALLALHVKEWHAPYVLVELELSLVGGGALGHGIIDQVAVVAETHRPQGTVLSVTALTTLLASRLLVPASHWLSGSEVLFFFIRLKNVRMSMPMMMVSIHRSGRRVVILIRRAHCGCSSSTMVMHVLLETHRAPVPLAVAGGDERSLSCGFLVNLVN